MNAIGPSALDRLKALAAEPFVDKRIRAIWLQIYDRLGRAIGSGVLTEGSRLPGEDDLAALFGVTRITLRRALARHQREGRLLARKGVGVFVRSISVRYVVHPDEAFSSPINEDGFSSETLSLVRRPADALSARIFGLDPGEEIVELRTLSAVSTAPFYLAVKEFPVSVFPDFEAAYRETGTILGAYAAGGVETYSRIETRIFADAASTAEAALLQLEPAAPLIRSRSLNTDPAGRIIEFNRGCWPMFSVELVFGNSAAPSSVDLDTLGRLLHTSAKRPA